MLPVQLRALHNACRIGLVIVFAARIDGAFVPAATRC
jgi:hypothetical protein